MAANLHSPKSTHVSTATTADRFEKVSPTRNTRRNLIRKRSEGEYEYGPTGKDAKASDAFTMPLERAMGEVVSPPMQDRGNSLFVCFEITNVWQCNHNDSCKWTGSSCALDRPRVLTNSPTDAEVPLHGTDDGFDCSAFGKEWKCIHKAVTCKWIGGSCEFDPTKVLANSPIRVDFPLRLDNMSYCSAVIKEWKCKHKESTCKWIGGSCKFDPTKSTVDSTTNLNASLPIPMTQALAAPQPVFDNLAGEDEIEMRNGAGAAIFMFCLGFILLASVALGFVLRSIKATKKKEMQLSTDTNLRDSRHWSVSKQAQNWSRWALPHPKSPMDDFSDMDIMAEVRHSTSGGWHGFYDDDQFQTIDLDVPSFSGDRVGDVTDDGLKEIEDGFDNYDISDMNDMSDMSDGDLINAYNEAMALDIEPESLDVEFTMQGIGSRANEDEGDQHQIT